MATLYAYPLGTPKTNDLIVGTSVPLPQTTTTDEQAKTVNFTVASIVALITTATGAQSFQQVTNIDQTTIGADLVSVTTNNVQITGIFYDSTDAKGTLGQVLTASALGKTVWATANTVTTVVLTAAQIQGLSTTPVELLPAPGANKAYKILACSTYLNFAVAFAGATSLSIYTTDGVSTISQVAVNSGAFLATSSTVYTLNGNSFSHNEIYVNSALLINAGVITGGTGSTLSIKLTYEILDTSDF